MNIQTQVQPRPIVAASCDCKTLVIQWQDNGLTGQWQLTDDEQLTQAHHRRYLTAQALEDKEAQ